MSKIGFRTLSARTLDQRVTNEIGLRLFDRSFLSKGGDGSIIKTHGRAYMQLLDRNTPFACHGRPIDNLADFISEKARQRKIEGCYTLQEEPGSFALRDALLCILAETEDLSWAALISVANNKVLLAKQYAREYQISTDAVLALMDGKTILDALIKEGRIRPNGTLLEKHAGNFDFMDLGDFDFQKIDLVSLGAMPGIFFRGQWGTQVYKTSRETMVRTIGNIVPPPSAGRLNQVLNKRSDLSIHSNIGNPLLRLFRRISDTHEKDWYVFPSIFSATGRALRANEQIIKRTIVSLGRYHRYCAGI